MVSRFIYLPCPSLQMKSCNSKKKLKRIRKYFQSAKSPDDMLRKTKWPKKKSMEVSITAITLRDSRIPKSQWYHEWWPPSCAKSAGCTLLRCCVHRLVTSLAPERCSKNLSSLSVDPGNFHNKVPQRASENWRYPQYSPIFLLIPSGQSGFLGLKVSVILFSSNSLRDHVETHGHKRAHLVEGYSLGTCGLATHVISRKTHHTLGFRIYKKMLYSLGFINAVMFGGKPYKRRERERDVFSRPNKHSHCCRILVIFHHVLTGITDFPKNSQNFPSCLDQNSSNFAVDDWPIHPIFQPGHRFAWPFQLHPGSSNSHQKRKKFLCFFGVSSSQKWVFPIIRVPKMDGL